MSVQITGITGPIVETTVSNEIKTADATTHAALAVISANTGAQNTDTVETGTIAALNAGVEVAAEGAYTVSTTISGTWVGTLVVEGKAPDDSWVILPMNRVQAILPYPATLSTTTNGTFLVTAGGFTAMRVRASAYTSGTANVSLNASLAQHTVMSAQMGKWSFEQNTDAFQRLRISEPWTQFDHMGQYWPVTAANQLKWDVSVTGTGATSQVLNQCSCRLTTGGTGSGAQSTIQTKRYFLYQPGKSRNVFMTFVMGAAKTNSTTEVGYGSSADGIFLQRADSTVQFVRRTNVTGTPVDNAVAQADWNIDKFDGTGLSGLTLDLTKAVILVIDLQYLGVGRVRCGFDFGGILYWAHEFVHAGILTNVYMSSGSQPLRAQVINTGVSNGTLTLDFICCSVISEGGFEEDRANSFSIDNGTTGIATSVTLIPIIAVRPATTFNGATYRGYIDLNGFSAYCQTREHRIVLLKSPTLTGGAWVSADSTYSAAEYNITASAVSGGKVVWSGYAPAATPRVVGHEEFGKGGDDILVYTSLGNVQETFALCAQTLTSTGTAFCRMTWQERY